MSSDAERDCRDVRAEKVARLVAFRTTSPHPGGIETVRIRRLLACRDAYTPDEVDAAIERAVERELVETTGSGELVAAPTVATSDDTDEGRETETVDRPGSVGDMHEQDWLLVVEALMAYAEAGEVQGGARRAEAGEELPIGPRRELAIELAGLFAASIGVPEERVADYVDPEWNGSDR